jgi:hypothetical protein
MVAPVAAMRARGVFRILLLVSAAIVATGFALLLSSAMFFTAGRDGCAEDAGPGRCCLLQAEDEFAAVLCPVLRLPTDEAVSILWEHSEGADLMIRPLSFTAGVRG